MNNKRTIHDKIADLYDNIDDIASGRGLPPPTTVVLNLEGFRDWYYYCEERGLDHTNWEGKQIIIDKEGVFPVAVSYHMDQSIFKQLSS